LAFVAGVFSSLTAVRSRPSMSLALLPDLAILRCERKDVSYAVRNIDDQIDDLWRTLFEKWVNAIVTSG
jgi:hypothetical protein